MIESRGLLGVDPRPQRPDLVAEFSAAPFVGWPRPYDRQRGDQGQLGPSDKGLDLATARMRLGMDLGSEVV